jgi:hemoglobin
VTPAPSRPPTTTFKETAAIRPGHDPLNLEAAHRALEIAPKEFDTVADELARSLDFFKVPKREKDEVLAAFAAHTGEVTGGSLSTATS